MIFTSVFDNIKSVILSIGFFDILDILIVAVLIYAILVRIRSTAFMRILLGVVMLFLVTWFTGAVKMRVINYVLSKIIEIGFIALVIVFQPEIRRTLEHFGSQSMQLLDKNGSTNRITARNVDKIVSACETMSEEKTGALIVFERDISLDEWIRSGTRVDAEISTELIRNLFFTKASLHDGAVIIRNGRVEAAGCVLPLTQNNSISTDLGTRHRAGLGMSEKSDAVVVIVSEETGAISVAVHGMLKRPLTPEVLKKCLTAELNLDETAAEPASIGSALRQYLLSLLKADGNAGGNSDDRSGKGEQQ